MEHPLNSYEDVCIICQFNLGNDDRCYGGKWSCSSSSYPILTATPVHEISDGLIEFIYPSRLQVDIKRNFLPQLYPPFLFTFHTDCYEALHACGCELSESKLLCLGLMRNRLYLPRGEPLLLLDQALLQLNNAFPKVQELSILFRLPLELQYKVAWLASPSAYSRFGVAITRTAPLLKEMHDPVSVPLEELGCSQEVKPRLANLARTLDITNIASRRNQGAPQSRKIRVGIGPFGVQYIEVDGKLRDRPSPWVEVIELSGQGGQKLIGVHNVRTTKPFHVRPKFTG
jgi:hypothetical protein